MAGRHSTTRRQITWSAAMRDLRNDRVKLDPEQDADLRERRLAASIARVKADLARRGIQFG